MTLAPVGTAPPDVTDTILPLSMTITALSMRLPVRGSTRCAARTTVRLGGGEAGALICARAGDGAAASANAAASKALAERLRVMERWLKCRTVACCGAL